MSNKAELEKEFYSIAHEIELLTDERDKTSDQLHDLKLKLASYDDEIDKLSKKIVSVGKRMAQLQI